MRKITGGKVYDTATARELASASNGGTWGDFSHWEETLYRKKTGEYFLHGEGGAMTRYAEATGQNEWSGGERIMPMTYAEAQAWAEEHLSGEAYEAIFGPVVEDDTKVVVSYRLSASTAETVKRRAAEAGMSISDYLDSVLK